jgi:ubiquinone/menaquinone biosynthesis C-methylase UbiE
MGMKNQSIVETEIKRQEEEVNDAFSKQSDIFDSLEIDNELVLLIRNNIRRHVLNYTTPSQTMLELNCGTGLDAMFFVNQGLLVHATDNAEGMLNQLQQKVIKYELQDKLTFQKCSFNELEDLDQKKYHHVFSNFGGLNCAPDLKKVIKSLDNLLEVNGVAHLVIMPRFCLWEISFVWKGFFKLAFRRFSLNGAKSLVEGLPFTTYYYSPRYVQKAFGETYETRSVKAMGCFIPPTYMDQMPKKRPNFFKKLVNLDAKHAHKWPFYNLGDHFIISIQKKR